MKIKIYMSRDEYNSWVEDIKSWTDGEFDPEDVDLAIVEFLKDEAPDFLCVAPIIIED